MAKKTYVLDTNVYLSDPTAFKNFGRNDILSKDNYWYIFHNDKRFLINEENKKKLINEKK